MAKFGIALEWGSRGRGFKSRHSDHQAEPGRVFAFQAQFFILSFHSRFQWVSFFVNVSQKSTVPCGRCFFASEQAGANPLICSWNIKTNKNISYAGRTTESDCLEQHPSPATRTTRLSLDACSRSGLSFLFCLFTRAFSGYLFLSMFPRKTPLLVDGVFSRRSRWARTH